MLGTLVKKFLSPRWAEESLPPLTAELRKNPLLGAVVFAYNPVRDRLELRAAVSSGTKLTQGLPARNTARAGAPNKAAACFSRALSLCTAASGGDLSIITQVVRDG
jgi:hypothetical protein